MERRFALLALPLLLLARAPSLGSAVGFGTGFAGGFDSILEKELERDVRALASPALEGRDTPSPGLAAAARLIEKRFADAGLEYAPDSLGMWRDLMGDAPPPAVGPVRPATAPQDPAAPGATPAAAAITGTYRRPFVRDLEEPDVAGCALSLEVGADPRTEMRFAKDFVPVRGCGGSATGEIVFAGFGIDSRIEKYNDLDGLKLRGKIALIVEGEPENARRFDGAEVTLAASLWEKVETLAAAGAAGVLAVRRPPTSKDAAEDAELGYRYEWASFNGYSADPAPKQNVPTLEISMRCAGALLGQDVDELAQKIDKTVRPFHVKSAGRRVSLKSATRRAPVRVENIVGVIRGSDPALSEEYVVVGAHYDHIGVDPRGRIGCGADDNGSGTAALLEIAEALAQAGPRRSVLVCSFAGEEEGLLGSKALCARLPVPREKIVAMVNMDMIGRGDANEVAVLGVNQNPGFEKLLDRARRLKPSGVKEVVTKKGDDLFERSDHYSFHKIGIPTLFFFEGLPIDRNKDYHTWRDTPDLLDTEKMLRTTRLVYNATWILANDDERPPRPQG